MTSSNRRALTIPEVLILIVAGVMVLSCGVLGQNQAQRSGHVAASMMNLRNFGAAHATYASEWNGRQWTTCPDNLSGILAEHTEGKYLADYKELAEVINTVPLGFSRQGRHFESRQGHLIQPIFWLTNCSLGSFRAFHTKPFNMYLNNKVYDPSFWAPDDYTMPAEIRTYFEDPGEWPGEGTPIYYPTYCMATSAMFHHDVFRAKSRGGFQDPREVEQGFRSPSLAHARFPDQKTHMLEHYWLRDRPSDAIPDSNGSPWFFNMGAGSTPATLFYDGHVRMLSVREALDSNRIVVDQGGDPLWVENETSCFRGGYFDQYAQNAEERTSFHVFTAEGIRGRDTVDPPR